MAHAVIKMLRAKSLNLKTSTLENTENSKSDEVKSKSKPKPIIRNLANLPPGPDGKP